MKKMNKALALLLAVMLLAAMLTGCGAVDADAVSDVALDILDEALAESAEEYAPEEEAPVEEPAPPVDADAVSDAALDILDEALAESAEEYAPEEVAPVEEPVPPEETESAAVFVPVEEPTEGITEDGCYTTKEDVALYIHTYGCLPGNFITKAEAEDLGWSGGGLENYAPGKCIGGSHFGNYEGLLPEKDGRSYTECDIDTLGASSRGAKRIVFSNDGLVYYTGDHYESFELLYGEP